MPSILETEPLRNRRPARGFVPGRRRVVARSAIVQARQRLGEEPLAYLFAVLAAEWATRSARAHAWRGLSLYGIDGTTIRVPDTKENRHAFGGQSVGNDTSCGYPLVRLVAVVALRSHLLSAVRFADFHTGEPVLAEQIWHELPDHSLTVLDRHYLSAELLNGIALSGTQRHWLTRAKRTTELKTLERYSKIGVVFGNRRPPRAGRRSSSMRRCGWTSETSMGTRRT